LQSFRYQTSALRLNALINKYVFAIVLKVIRRTKKKSRQDQEASMKVCNSFAVIFSVGQQSVVC